MEIKIVTFRPENSSVIENIEKRLAHRVRKPLIIIKKRTIAMGFWSFKRAQVNIIMKKVDIL